MLAACVAASLLTGCDQQQSEEAMNKLKAFFNAVKPDTLLLKDLKPGITTEAQIRDQMGEPETERTFTDGSKRLRISARSGGHDDVFRRSGPQRALRFRDAGAHG